MTDRKKRYTSTLSSLGPPTTYAGALYLRHSLALLLLLHLQQQGTVDMRQHTSKGDRCPNKSVELFVAADGQLKMTRGDTLHLQVLGRVL